MVSYGCGNVQSDKILVRTSHWDNPLPRNLITISQGTDDYVDISWGAGSNASTYQIYRSLTSNPLDGHDISGWINATSFEDHTATPGIVYYYFLRSAGHSGSNPSGFTTSYYSHSKTGYRTSSAPDSVYATYDVHPNRIVISSTATLGANFYRFYRKHNQ